MLLEVDRYKWNRFNISVKPQRRRVDFVEYTEPFRPLDADELKSISRLVREDCLPIPFCDAAIHEFQISYQALTGGFTICNIIVNGKLYSGSSHCSKVDQWLPIRGQMLAFKRALESTGITLPFNLPNGENSDSEF